MPAVTHRRRLILPALALVGLLAVSACLGDETATPTPDAATVAPSPLTPGSTPLTPGATDVVLGPTDVAPGPTDVVPGPTDVTPGPSGAAPSEAGSTEALPPAGTSAGPTSSAAPPASASPSGVATATAPAAPGPRDQETLVVMAPQHPRRLLPGNYPNVTERLLVDLLYDPLYRLDETMQPVPELAKTLPTIGEDGTRWEIPIRTDARFHDGEKLTASDVLFSLRMAASPSCPLGDELCAAVRDHMVENPQRDDNVVTITLAEPYMPFLTEALGRLPILSEAAVKRATDDLIDAADRLGQNRPDTIVADITSQMQRDPCIAAEPPEGCRLVDHRDTLERIFRRARLDLPSQAPFTDDAGYFDEDGYLGELLVRIGALGQVFTTENADKRSAALGLLDATVEPFGSGPYRLIGIDAEGRYTLEANEDHTRSVAEIARIEIKVQRDPSVAVTRLLSGEADWILEVGPELAGAVSGVPGVRAARRPLDLQYGILFNVRPGRVYFDVDARRAFALCLDHEGLGRALDEDRFVATGPYTASSWVPTAASVRERDVAAATALLDEAGWSPAADGVRSKDDVRLSTTIAVRPTSVDLFTFANQAAEQLSECGIELVVEELDLTGDTMLSQLLWPNDFDTLLWARSLGPDPDGSVRAFESSRVTSEENQADANPSGFTSQLADFLIASARASQDQTERAEAYAQIAELLAQDVPYWPLWYESAMGALSTRVLGSDGPIDPSRPRYAWDVAGWRLGPARG